MNQSIQYIYVVVYSIAMWIWDNNFIHHHYSVSREETKYMRYKTIYHSLLNADWPLDVNKKRWNTKRQIFLSLFLIVVFVQLLVQWTAIAAPTGQTDQNGHKNNSSNDNCHHSTGRNGERATRRLPTAHVRPCTAPIVVVPVGWLRAIGQIAVTRWTPENPSIGQSTFNVLSNRVIECLSISIIHHCRQCD